MERRTHIKRLDRPELGGFIELPRLIELNRDAIRAYYTKEEKKVACKLVMRELIKWSAYTPEEAVGLLEIMKFTFVQMAEDIREKEDD